MPNQPKTPLRNVRIDDDTWRELSERREEGETMSDVLRRAVRMFLAGAAVLLVVFGLSACGGADEPAAANPPATSTATVTSEPVIDAPSGEPTSEVTEECWTDPDMASPHWQDQFNEISSDPVRAVEMLDALPDPSEGCGPAEVASLEYAQEVAQDMRERFPQLFS